MFVLKPAAAVIGEAQVAWDVARAFLENLPEIP